MKILCDTHSHTIASTHAYSTVHDYFAAAKEKGIAMFGITDHGVEMPDSPHAWHFGNMKIVPREHNGAVMLRAIEANICNDQGRLDIDVYYDGFLDYAIASFHEPVWSPGSEAQNTQAMIRAMETGLVQIIGHPGNPSYPINYDDVVRAAKDNNVLLEINNSSFRKSRPGSGPRCRAIMEAVIKHDWKVSFGSDAHISLDLGNFENCIDLAIETGLPETSVATRTPDSFLAFLGEHGKPVAHELADFFQTSDLKHYA